MERYEIEAFLAVAEELHFGRAAGRLRVSTGRISQTIKAIERRFGAPLFERTSRRVALTPIGRQLYEDLAPGLRQVQLALDRAASSGRGTDGILDVGFVGAAAVCPLIMDTIKEFRAEHPGAEVRFREVQHTDGLEGWRSEEYDMVLISRPVSEPDLVTGPTLVSEQRMLALPRTHPLAAKTALSQEDLAEITLLRMPGTIPASVRDDRTPARTPSGRPIAHGPIAYTFQELLALIGAGEGAFVVGARTAHFYLRPDISYLPIDDALPIEWGFVWRVSRETARVRAFNDTALRVSKIADDR
ncbi:LysR family transcriptional regulator [Nocardia sp. NPDC056000]|uniref:LysR family transcriptional regulator n=1 Tax=Nocardia sp. NPDC056000 TaxID=3345674 RepID=UPI0035DAAE97